MKKWLTNLPRTDIIFCVTLEVDYAFATQALVHGRKGIPAPALRAGFVGARDRGIPSLFPHPVVVEGEVRVSADVVSLRAEARYLFEGACDRCLRDIRCERLVPVEHILVTSLNNEDNGEFVLVDNYQLPLDSLVEADLILSLPSKVLCREDCRGLSPTAARIRTRAWCGCKPQAADPRLEALGQWNHS